MVEISSHKQLTVTPVSARDLYLSRSTLKVRAQPTPAILLIPTTGVSTSSAGSLAWIDTAFAQGLETRHFLDSIERGDIPSALSPSSQHPVDIQLFHQCPTRLSEGSVTLIEALGVATTLESLARQSTTLLCPHCGELSERQPTPSHALSALRKRAKAPCAVFAEGPPEALMAWSRAHGFHHDQTDTGNSTARLRVQVDSLGAQTEEISRLSPLAHSLWRLRDAALVCVQESGTHTVSKEGICPGCGYSFTADRAAENSETARLRARVLTHGRSFQQVLTEPLHQLASLPALATSRALSYALRTHLRDRAAETTTSALSAQELAAVAVCRSLSDAVEARGTCVIDIPTLLLSNDSSSPLLKIVSEAATTSGIVIVEPHEVRPHEPLCRSHRSPSGKQIGTLRINSVDYSIESGMDISITGISFNHVEALIRRQARIGHDSLFTPIREYEVISIPIFKSFRRSRSMLFHQLGLTEALARLFAASVDARSTGLTTKDFTLSSARANKNICATCDGLGVTLSHREEVSRPAIAECPACDGSRFTNDVGCMSWRGVSLSALLSTPIAEILSLLRALPRAMDAIMCLEALCLTHLPLGMPLALMSDSELHALLFIQALLSATPTKPIIAIIEMPCLSLSVRRRGGVLQLLETAPRAQHLSLVMI
jgi:hypothetical protein